jgi:3-oxoacyl-[acyl-carrier-protein] synthase-3
MHLPELVSELLKQNDLTLEDIKLVIPHQASLGAMRLIQRRLKIRQDKCMEIIQKYGNCVAASMPMALQSAISEKRLQSGDIALLIGAGAGVTLGATLVQI